MKSQSIFDLEASKFEPLCQLEAYKYKYFNNWKHPTLIHFFPDKYKRLSNWKHSSFNDIGSIQV